MDFLYRSPSPAYKGSTPSNGAPRGFLGSLWCYLFGGGTPRYRSAHGGAGSAGPVVNRCWWQAFPASPSYKAAPPAPAHDDVSDEPVPGDVGDPDCACPADEGTCEDVPAQIHIWAE